LQTVENVCVQWLQALLVAGLTALLAESTHGAIQHRAEQGLHLLLQKLFAAIPDASNNQEMLGKTERALQAILRESLDAVFVQGTRATVQLGGQQAIEKTLHGDFGEARRCVENTFRARADALGVVLARQWQTVLRLAIALALLALESALANSNKAQ
jgi:hypothetical protein